MLFGFLVCFVWQDPAAQMGGLVLFLLKRARSCVASATGRQPLVIGKPDISPWVGAITDTLPHTCSLSSNDFPPRMMGAGIAQTHECACLLC